MFPFALNCVSPTLSCVSQWSLSLHFSLISLRHSLFYCITLFSTPNIFQEFYLPSSTLTYNYSYVDTHIAFFVFYDTMSWIIPCTAKYTDTELFHETYTCEGSEPSLSLCFCYLHLLCFCLWITHSHFDSCFSPFTSLTDVIPVYVSLCVSLGNTIANQYLSRTTISTCSWIPSSFLCVSLHSPCVICSGS